MSWVTVQQPFELISRNEISHSSIILLTLGLPPQKRRSRTPSPRCKRAAEPAMSAPDRSCTGVVAVFEVSTLLLAKPRSCQECAEAKPPLRFMQSLSPSTWKGSRINGLQTFRNVSRLQHGLYIFSSAACLHVNVTSTVLPHIQCSVSFMWNGGTKYCLPVGGTTAHRHCRFFASINAATTPDSFFPFDGKDLSSPFSFLCC